MVQDIYEVLINLSFRLSVFTWLLLLVAWKMASQTPFIKSARLNADVCFWLPALKKHSTLMLLYFPQSPQCHVTLEGLSVAHNIFIKSAKTARCILGPFTLYQSASNTLGVAKFYAAASKTFQELTLLTFCNFPLLEFMTWLQLLKCWCRIYFTLCHFCVVVFYSLFLLLYYTHLDNAKLVLLILFAYHWL